MEHRLRRHKQLNSDTNAGKQKTEEKKIQEKEKGGKKREEKKRKRGLKGGVVGTPETGQVASVGKKLNFFQEM